MKISKIHKTQTHTCHETALNIKKNKKKEEDNYDRVGD